MISREPFPKICIALGFRDVNSLLQQAQREAEQGERFLEFRLDYLNRPEAGALAIREFAAKFPEVVILATCRRQPNHGKFDGSVEKELSILHSAVDYGAQAVDVEVESAESAPHLVAALRENARLIVSWHHFESTPLLPPILKRLQRVPADAYKLVTTACKPSDVGRVLAIGLEHSRVPLMTLAMGEVGVATRVLSPAYNGLFTYAAPSSSEGTAPGQLSATMLRKQFRLGKITRHAKIFCVIADPVRHSLSPAVHNRAFELRRMDAVYLPMLVGSQQLPDFFKLAATLPINGFSVTIPHKQKIIRYLDIVDPLAKRIGAVNTVWRKGGKWRGANTDAAAVVKPLERHIRVARSRVLIAGSGGAARSAACVLADGGAHVTITGRNLDRARMLARFAGGNVLSREQAERERFDVVVHATPLGMYPHADTCFFDEIIPAEIVFDMVYNPLETTLIRRAKTQGKQVITGLKMFVEQAVAQFELWTGESAPRQAMENAALRALEGQVVCSPANTTVR